MYNVNLILVINNKNNCDITEYTITTNIGMQNYSTYLIVVRIKEFTLGYVFGIAILRQERTK